VKRRRFISLFGAAAASVSLPRSVRAQQMRRVGVLMTVQESDPATQRYLATFQSRLKELGWIEDQTVRFNRRWAGGVTERMRAHIVEIAGLKPDVIVAQNTPMVAALRRETTTIPIVFVQVSDPLGDGFVQSLARPGTNATGFTNTMSSLGGKWVELLKEAAPAVSQVGYLFNRVAAPGNGEYYMEPLLTAAAALGLKAVRLELSNPGEIDRVIADFAAMGGNGLVANSDSFITVNRERINAAATRHRLPIMGAAATQTVSGGLLSYGADPAEQWQAAAGYIDRILRGEKPADLPVQQPAQIGRASCRERV